MNENTENTESTESTDAVLWLDAAERRWLRLHGFRPSRRGAAWTRRLDECPRAAPALLLRLDFKPDRPLQWGARLYAAGGAGVAEARMVPLAGGMWGTERTPQEAAAACLKEARVLMAEWNGLLQGDGTDEE